MKLGGERDDLGWPVYSTFFGKLPNQYLKLGSNNLPISTLPSTEE